MLLLPTGKKSRDRPTVGSVIQLLAKIESSHTRILVEHQMRAVLDEYDVTVQADPVPLELIPRGTE